MKDDSSVARVFCPYVWLDTYKVLPAEWMESARINIHELSICIAEYRKEKQARNISFRSPFPVCFVLYYFIVKRYTQIYVINSVETYCLQGAGGRMAVHGAVRDRPLIMKQEGCINDGKWSHAAWGQG